MHTPLTVHNSSVTVFLGKCNNHAYGGWREICHANTFTDTMAPKFRKASSTRFAVRQLRR